MQLMQWCVIPSTSVNRSGCCLTSSSMASRVHTTAHHQQTPVASQAWSSASDLDCCDSQTSISGMFITTPCGSVNRHRRMDTVQLALQLLSKPEVSHTSAHGPSDISWRSETRSAAPPCPPAPRRAPPALVLMPAHEVAPCCQDKLLDGGRLKAGPLLALTSPHLKTPSPKLLENLSGALTARCQAVHVGMMQVQGTVSEVLEASALASVMKPAAAADLGSSRAACADPAPATALPAASTTATPFSWSILPESILTRILDFVDVRDRCCSCALVNSTWSAAAAATRRVSLNPGPSPSPSDTDVSTADVSTGRINSRAFTHWLSKQTQTTALEIHIEKQDGSLNLQHLTALSKLRQLQLRGYKPDRQGGLHSKQGLHFQLAPGGSSSSKDEEGHSAGSDSAFDEYPNSIFSHDADWAHDADGAVVGSELGLEPANSEPHSEAASSDHEIHGKHEAASSDHEVHDEHAAAGSEHDKQEEVARDDGAEAAAGTSHGATAAAGSSQSAAGSSHSAATAAGSSHSAAAASAAAAAAAASNLCHAAAAGGNACTAAVPTSDHPDDGADLDSEAAAEDNHSISGSSSSISGGGSGSSSNSWNPSGSSFQPRFIPRSTTQLSSPCADRDDYQPPTALSALTALTKLVLSDVIVKGGPPALQALSVLTQLRHLDVGWCGPDSDNNSGVVYPIPGCIFKSLLQLTHLSLHCSVSRSTLQHLGQLQQLQQLKLGLLLPITTAAAAADVAVVGNLQQLTTLTLFGAWFPIDSVTMPWLGELTGLRVLSLHSVVSIEPAVFSSCTQLYSLHLKGCMQADPKGLVQNLGPKSEPKGPTGLLGSLRSGRQSLCDSQLCDSQLCDSQLCDSQSDTRSVGREAGVSNQPSELSESAAGVASLLQLLPSLQHLTQLSLPGVLSQCAPNAAAYSALTASSALRRLDISGAVLPTATTAATAAAAVAAAAPTAAAAAADPAAADPAAAANPTAAVQAIDLPTEAVNAAHPTADCAGAACSERVGGTGAAHCADSSCVKQSAGHDSSDAFECVDSWQFIFPPNRQLSFLTQLCLAEVDGGEGAVKALVRCCPQLQQLTVKCSSSSSSSGGSFSSQASCSKDTNLADFSSSSRGSNSDGNCQQQQQQQQQGLLPLAQLSQLTGLAVDNIHTLGASAAVAQVTQLRKLQVRGHCTPRSCLQELTALRGLEVLESWSGVDQLKVDWRTHPPALLVLTNKAPYGSPPDVHQQLLQHCTSRPHNRSKLSRTPVSVSGTPEQAALDSCSSDDGSICCDSTSCRESDAAAEVDQTPDNVHVTMAAPAAADVNGMAQPGDEAAAADCSTSVDCIPNTGRDQDREAH